MSNAVSATAKTKMYASCEAIHTAVYYRFAAVISQWVVFKIIFFMTRRFFRFMKITVWIILANGDFKQ